ncbi:MAG: hypothetical protein AAGJ46_20450 [Planctomycetota bacterium]
MPGLLRVISMLICLSATALGAPDHHAIRHTHGPNGGVLLPVGEKGFQVEVLVRDAELLTIRVFDSESKPVESDAKQLTVTFTESDGEVEDYKVRARTLKTGEQVFQRKSSHVVEHVMQDTMAVTVSVGGDLYKSHVFSYPHGPHGGELVGLDKTGLQAELLVDGDFVHVYLLDGKKRPRRVSASEVTLVFTEEEGETEDYQIDAKSGDSPGTVFEIEDDHVVGHVLRDSVAIKLVLKDTTLVSTTFRYADR